MPGMITRCPKCSTAFRISDNHLKSAQGMVRCGSCLHVFDAKSHLEPLTAKPEKTASQTKPNNTNKPSPTASKVNPPKAKTKRARAQPASSPSPQGKPTTQKPAIQTPLFSSQEKVESIYGSDEPDEDAWALALLEDDPEEPVSPKKAPPKEVKVNEVESGKPKAERASESIQAQEPKPQLKPDTKTNIEPATPESEEIELMAHIPDNDITLDWQENEPAERLKGRRWVWPAALAIAAFALLAQLAWLQFPTLSLKQPYRSYYGALCTLLPCKLPERLDRANISATNLIVRSHPKLDDALLVDVIIKNTAAFEQRFPNLRLSFTDTSNKIIAARKLTPAEYLGGELAGINAMPIQQPIHIAIDVKDPGDSAVGYKIEVVD